MPIGTTEQRISVMKRLNGYHPVASLEDIKTVLRESGGIPVIMVLTQNIIIDGTTIKA